MNVFVSVGIIILAMLIVMFMQIPSGIFALFHHYASGKYSKNRTSLLSTFFFLGVETITTCLFLSCLYLSFLFSGAESTIPHLLDWIISIIMLVLAFLSFFFYYRSPKSTETFIPRWAVSSLDQNARTVKTRSDAFMLGAFSGTCELIFTIPLILLVAAESLNIITSPLSIFSFFFILSPLIPLFLYRSIFHADHNLADIIKFRTKNRFYTRLILSLSYLLIALLIIFFRILA